ncbi:ComEA family DNA-binding protein [Faecalicatena contorta]|uniref:ComEA family DNA-binding protein n=1 Tax=Faecalicatena contorta TaxID=39482 RepID=UPI001F40DEA2|nr:ComEA family DNA-binding protein [Faecalicatena contorta]MCF2681233.1 ComEA family DNA-binding protein [Faecalicatena contorta]
MRRKYWYLYCILWIFAVCQTVGCASEEPAAELETVEMKETAEEEKEDTDILEEHIFVYVCGCVHTPGVYELLPDSRVYEALEAAGGMTEEAAFSSLNQAEKISDGQKIYVPSFEEAENQTITEEEEDGQVNLNTASKEVLMTLPGIGEVKAEAIIHYREKKGSFTSIDELKEIEGIKEGVFNKIKDHVKV